MYIKKFIHAFHVIITNPTLIKQYGKQLASCLKMWTAFFLLLFVKKRLYNRNIWIVREKGTEARDNGFFFYKHIREKHPEIHAYYIISKDSADYSKVSQYNNIIRLNSLKHYMFSLAAKVSASSQPYGALPYPSDFLFSISKSLRRKDQIVVFLQHGIIHNELPHSYDYNKTKFDLFCCASDRERRFIQEIHGYPDDNIKTVGMCRFDNLIKSDKAKKVILVMPTHRTWLHSSDTMKEATEKEKKDFIESVYYKAYASLLSNDSLVSFSRRNDYKIVFYPHYALQSYIGCFMQYENDVVTIADREHYDVQKLLVDSAILVTDYSSVFFDFAYMEKPIVYYQFDKEQFRKNHFKQGYFDYITDGFGPVYESEKEIVNEIKIIVENQCVMNDMYYKRIKGFFRFHDTNNCSRTFDEVYRKAISK